MLYAKGGHEMDQMKIGSFLKKLRNEKGLTQEQAGEQFNVSRRTVTRWETGANMPDLGILVEVADFYDVDLRELFDGERRSERMDKELEQTVKRAAEYSNMEKSKAAKVVLVYLVIGTLSLIANQALMLLDISGSFWTGFAKGATAGMALCSLIFAFLYVTGRLTKLAEAKKRLVK